MKNQLKSKCLIATLIILTFACKALCQSQEIINYKLDSGCADNSIYMYHANGKIMSCGTALKTGKWCFWDEEGNLDAIRYYSVSKKDSVLITFLDKGSVRSSSIFENDRKRFWIIYDSNFVLRELYDYFNDSLVRIITFRTDKTLETISLQTYGKYDDLFGPQRYEVLEFNLEGILTRRKIYTPPTSDQAEW